MQKDGAVKCDKCGSCDVEHIKTASVVISEGNENLEETYACLKCGQNFSKIS